MEIITRKQALEQGLTRYFTGKPCKRGHVDERLTVNGYCLICRDLKNREYHSDNREKIVSRQKEYRELNSEKMRENRKKYYVENRDAELSRSKKYVSENRDRMLAKKKEYRENNKEKIREYNSEYKSHYYCANREKLLQIGRQYRIDNKHKVNAWSKKHKVAKLQRTPRWLTPEDHKHIEWLYAFAAHLTELKGVPYHVDHIIPLQGKNVSGLHVPSNLRVIPGVENVRKSNKFDV